MSVGAPPAGAQKSNKAVISLVLGILGIVCCQILGPIAWYMANQELAAIKAGASDASQKGLATAGMITGIVGTIFLCLSLVWILFFGGLAMLGSMAGR